MPPLRSTKSAMQPALRVAANLAEHASVLLLEFAALRAESKALRRELDAWASRPRAHRVFSDDAFESEHGGATDAAGALELELAAALEPPADARIRGDAGDPGDAGEAEPAASDRPTVPVASAAMTDLAVAAA
jgi:hypothetical protein